MSCPDCGYYNGGHHDACPSVRFRLREEFEAGKAAGRNRQPCWETATSAYRLGWTRGDAAADEAENSVPWSQ
jgi:hypothetical protein